MKVLADKNSLLIENDHELIGIQSIFTRENEKRQKMENNRVCPWWLGYFLINPLRRFSNDPERMFSRFVKPGMTVIDYGCAMGYFSLPLARMVGPEGKVYCFDIQQKMLDQLMKRAGRTGLHPNIIPRLIQNNGADFDGMEQTADFALLFAVAHEVPDQKKLFIDICQMMKPGAFLYFAEPPGHVTQVEFERSVGYAEQGGFKREFDRLVPGSRSAVMSKK